MRVSYSGSAYAQTYSPFTHKKSPSTRRERVNAGMKSAGWIANARVIANNRMADASA